MTENGLESNDGMGRRTLLRRAAMGGAAVVWATPVVQTLGMGVAAAGTPVVVACPDADSTRPTTLTFKWTGEPCSDPPPTAQTASSGNTTGTISETVYVTATYGPGGNATTVEWLSVDQNDMLTIGPKPPGNWDAVLVAGDQKLNPETTFEVYDEKGGTLLRSVTLHTSCSQPLHLNDNFCGFVLQGATF